MTPNMTKGDNQSLLKNIQLEPPTNVQKLTKGVVRASTASRPKGQNYTHTASRPKGQLYQKMNLYPQQIDSVWALWGKRLKILSVGHSFFSIFQNLRTNNGQAFSGTFALRLYKSYYHCQCSTAAPVQHMWQAQGQASKQWRQDVDVLKVKTLSEQDCHSLNSTKKNTKSTAIQKCQFQCRALTGSVPCKMA